MAREALTRTTTARTVNGFVFTVASPTLVQMYFMTVHRLFVGGLAPDVRADDVQARFARFGTVRSTEVVCDDGVCRGFAYVDLEVTESNLQQCLKVYTGTKWRGRALIVEPARPDYLSRLQEEWDEAQEATVAAEDCPQDEEAPSADASPLPEPVTATKELWVKRGREAPFVLARPGVSNTHRRLDDGTFDPSLAEAYFRDRAQAAPPPAAAPYGNGARRDADLPSSLAVAIATEEAAPTLPAMPPRPPVPASSAGPPASTAASINRSLISADLASELEEGLAEILAPRVPRRLSSISASVEPVGRLGTGARKDSKASKGAGTMYLEEEHKVDEEEEEEEEEEEDDDDEDDEEGGDEQLASTEEEDHVLDGVEVDGPMAGDEDAAEMARAEGVVADNEAAQAPVPLLPSPLNASHARQMLGLPVVRGKGGMMGKVCKRRRKVLRDNIQGITKPAIRRLARRGGVKRISGLIYEEVRGVLKVFLENVLRDAVTYTEHRRNKTVTAMDVVYALKRQGRTIYGFGG